MLGTIIILFFLGLSLLVAEAFLPGGIVGLFGAVAIVISSVICYREYGPGVGTIYMVGSLTTAIVVGLTSFLFVARKLALTPPVPVESENSPSGRIGKIATVITALNPTGFVRLDGKRLQARSESSDQLITEGNEVEIAAIDGSFLVARPTVKETV